MIKNMEEIHEQPREENQTEPDLLHVFAEPTISTIQKPTSNLDMLDRIEQIMDTRDYTPATVTRNWDEERKTD